MGKPNEENKPDYYWKKPLQDVPLMLIGGLWHTDPRTGVYTDPCRVVRVTENYRKAVKE